MRFAHISDLHLCNAPGADTAAQEHADAVATALAGDLERISEILDFIVVSGDITDDAHPLSFRRFEELFAPLTPPLLLIPGNHDGPSTYFREAGSGLLAQWDLTGRVADLGAVRLLGLDTCIENKTGGALTDESLELVARELASSRRSRLIIVMHHPPFAPGLQAFDEIAHLDGAEDLARLLDGAQTAPILLCGHVHRVYQARWHGAFCFVAGSPTLPFTSQLPFGNTPIHPSDEGLCYHVHAIDSANHVVTPQPVPRFAPPS